MININYFVTDMSITLYWDKPYDLPEEYFFCIYVDGIKTGESAKTHYTIEDLESNRKYRVQVTLKDAANESVLSDIVTVTTDKRKKKIDITLPPYCAIGDGITKNTTVLQQAIDDCDEESVVYFPAGVYLTGSLKLHSNMQLYMEEGAVLQGSSNPEDYLPKIPSRFEGYEMECYSSLLNLGDLDHNSGYHCCNVMIYGKGTIAGGSLTLAKRILETEKNRLKSILEGLGDAIKEYENADTLPGRARGRLINMSNCQNIILSGLILRDGPSWNIHMIYSDHIITHNCRIYSKGIWNGDGWDPDSSTHCTVFGTTFCTGDDAIAIKSGKNPEGNIINRPCEHIRIFDCITECGHGIAIGSEMSGGVNDVQIWDCDLKNVVFGIEIKGTKKRGGYVKNICVRDCVVSRIMFHSVDYNDDGISAGDMPCFQDCAFLNLHILGEYPNRQGERVPCEAFELVGFDNMSHKIQNVLFKDIHLKRMTNKSKFNLSLQYCGNITFQNMNVE